MGAHGGHLSKPTASSLSWGSWESLLLLPSLPGVPSHASSGGCPGTLSEHRSVPVSAPLDWFSTMCCLSAHQGTCTQWSIVAQILGSCSVPGIRPAHLALGEELCRGSAVLALTELSPLGPDKMTKVLLNE